VSLGLGDSAESSDEMKKENSEHKSEHKSDQKSDQKNEIQSLRKEINELKIVHALELNTLKYELDKTKKVLKNVLKQTEKMLII
jgi:hypothetical protein